MVPNDFAPNFLFPICSTLCCYIFVYTVLIRQNLVGIDRLIDDEHIDKTSKERKRQTDKKNDTVGNF